MDSVNRIDPQAGLGTAAPHGSNKLGKDEFLKLLMAQLGQQDPTAPVGQPGLRGPAGQFASLELQQNANIQPREHADRPGLGANQTALTNFVGKDVVYQNRPPHPGGRAAGRWPGPAGCGRGERDRGDH